MNKERLESALIVSDPWHLRRATLIAEDEGIKAEASGTKTSRYQSFRAKATFFIREIFNVQVYQLLGT